MVRRAAHAHEGTWKNFKLVFFFNWFGGRLNRSSVWYLVVGGCRIWKVGWLMHMKGLRKISSS